jgi:hypothetical protein
MSNAGTGPRAMYRKMTMLKSTAMRALTERPYDDPQRAGIIDFLDICNREIKIARAGEAPRTTMRLEFKGAVAFCLPPTAGLHVSIAPKSATAGRRLNNKLRSPKREDPWPVREHGRPYTEWHRYQNNWGWQRCRNQQSCDAARTNWPNWRERRLTVDCVTY